LKSIGSGIEFERIIEDKLKSAGVSYKRNVGIGGAQLDFLIKTPEKHSFILEAKSWPDSPQNLSRARSQANNYAKVTNTDVLIVLPKGKSDPDQGVITFDNLEEEIQRITEKLMRKPTAKTKPLTIQSTQRSVFVAMPFSSEYDDTYFVAMIPAAKEVNATCKRTDKEDFSGDIVSAIKTRIKQSIAVIADLSEANPNVLYEVGYAHALNKSIIHICCTPLDKLPFDVRNWSTISYERGRTHLLCKPLVTRLTSLVS
jgi:hypothetical protein